MADTQTGGKQTVVVCFLLEGFERDYTREELLSRVIPDTLEIDFGELGRYDMRKLYSLERGTETYTRLDLELGLTEWEAFGTQNLREIHAWR